MPIFGVIEQVEGGGARMCIHCFDIQTLIGIWAGDKKELFVNWFANLVPVIRQRKFDNPGGVSFLRERVWKRK